MIYTSPESEPPEELRELIHTDAVVRSCWMHHVCGNISREQALVMMVVNVASQRDGYFDSYVKLCERSLIYTALKVPE